MYEKLISQSSLLTPLPKHEIRRLKATLRQPEFPPNTVLFREGDYGIDSILSSMSVWKS